jgi:hypothetical protein
MPIRQALLMLAALGVAWLTGCQNSGVEKPYPITGEVKLDDAPMQSGEVIFEMAGKVPRQFEVNNGQFRGEAPPGQYVVRINSYITGQFLEQPTGPGAENASPPRENIVDPQFNTASKLTVEVKANNSNQFSFTASNAARPLTSRAGPLTVPVPAHHASRHSDCRSRRCTAALIRLTRFFGPCGLRPHGARGKLTRQFQ